jgi:hypothetical protein
MKLDDIVKARFLFDLTALAKRHALVIEGDPTTHALLVRRLEKRAGGRAFAVGDPLVRLHWGVRECYEELWKGEGS